MLACFCRIAGEAHAPGHCTPRVEERILPYIPEQHPHFSIQLVTSSYCCARLHCQAEAELRSCAGAVITDPPSCRAAKCNLGYAAANLPSA